MPTYRGIWNDVGRAAHPGCAVERYDGDAVFCYTRAPVNAPGLTCAWVCTRPAGHRGDHVAHGLGGIVLGRWGPNGETEDAPEPEPEPEPAPEPAPGSARFWSGTSGPVYTARLVDFFAQWEAGTIYPTDEEVPL